MPPCLLPSLSPPSLSPFMCTGATPRPGAGPAVSLITWPRPCFSRSVPRPTPWQPQGPRNTLEHGLQSFPRRHTDAHDRTHTSTCTRTHRHTQGASPAVQTALNIVRSVSNMFACSSLYLSCTHTDAHAHAHTCTHAHTHACRHTHRLQLQQVTHPCPALHPL